MAVRETVEIDLDRVDRLIDQEEAALEPKHRRAIEYQEEAMRRLRGGVSSSWHTSPPNPIYISHGKGSKVWDIDGNEYADYHNGYGVMAAGHANPRIVEAVQRRIELGSHFAQPTEDALFVAD